MQDFFSLTPDAVLGAVEQALSGAGAGDRVRATGRTFTHASMENRVYEIELEEPLPGVGLRVVAKFYRPGRWSAEALADEHAFLQELAAAEVPVVGPLALPGAGGGTLSQTDTGIRFAVFP